MSAFREAIAKEVRKELMNPEFDSRRSKNGGRVFWVKLAAATGFGQFVKEHPAYDDNVAAVHVTMSSAAGAVVADRGDEIRVTEGHTETFTKAFCLSTAGVRWVGEGSGTKVPALTVSGGVHGVAVEGAGVEFDNFRFPIPGADEALSMIRVKAAGCTVQNIVGLASGTRVEGSATETNNFIDCIRIVAGADDFTLNNIRLDSTPGAVPNSFLSFEGAVSRFTSAGFYATGSVGTAGVIDASGARQKGSYIKDWRIAVGGSAKPAVTLDTVSSEGMVHDCFFAGTDTTLATNAQFAGDWRRSQVYVSEAAGNLVQGALTPAVDTD